MDTFSQQFQLAIPRLRRQILSAFESNLTQAGFRSIWENFEKIVNPVLISFFKRPPLSIPLSDIKEAKSKSVYPDLEIRFEDKHYAIDIKSGEDHMDPWYDISRLDTYEEKHLRKYAAEFSVVVRWKGRRNTKIVDIYIEPTYQTVGYKEDSDGVLYRPYDGKLRPKPWKYFEQQKTFWDNMTKFKKGLANSLNFRRKSYILEWYQKMDTSQRKAIKKDINAINRGKPIQIDGDVIGDEGQNSSL